MLLLTIILWDPFLVCSEVSVLPNNQQSQIINLPTANWKVPFLKHPFRRHLVKQGVHLSAGSLGPTWPCLHRPTRGESDDVKFVHNGLSGLREMGKVGHKVWNPCLFVANKLVFRRVPAFIYTFQLSAARDLQTRLKEHLSVVSILSPYSVFVLFIYFFPAPCRPRCLSFIWQRRDVMKRRVLVRHNAAARCHKRTGRGTFGSRAERYQLKVCEMRTTFQNSPNAPSYAGTHWTGGGSSRADPRQSW